jgi:putative tryptophan/tyrosine transport system substrate-binding protein
VDAAGKVAQSVDAAVRDGADAVVLAYKFSPGVGAAAALQARIPAISRTRSSGALLAFGANIDDMHRRAAAHVDKILKGTKAADLPVEQPTALDLVVDLKVAEYLGLAVPKSVLAQATEIDQ